MNYLTSMIIYRCTLCIVINYEGTNSDQLMMGKTFSVCDLITSEVLAWKDTKHNWTQKYSSDKQPWLLVSIQVFIISGNFNPWPRNNTHTKKNHWQHRYVLHTAKTYSTHTLRKTTIKHKKNNTKNNQDFCFQNQPGMNVGGSDFTPSAMSNYHSSRKIIV